FKFPRRSVARAETLDAYRGVIRRIKSSGIPRKSARCFAMFCRSCHRRDLPMADMYFVAQHQDPATGSRNTFRFRVKFVEVTANASKQWRQCTHQAISTRL